MATTDMNAQIHIKDGNGNVNNIFPATKIENVEGLQTALNSKANTSDVTSGLALKVDKETGKGLSTNDYTTTEKNKLAGIEAQANKTVVDSALSTTSTNPVQNKVINTALGNKADASTVSALATTVSGKADSSTVTALTSRVSEAETDIATQTARIDAIAALPSGSTSGDAELIDIRTKADGTTAANAGTAVREQINSVNDILKFFNCINICNKDKRKVHDSGNGITYDWVESGNSYTVKGGTQVGSSSFYNIFDFSGTLPDYIKAGDYNFFEYTTSSSDVVLEIYMSVAGGTLSKYAELSESRFLFIPNNVTRMIVRLFVSGNKPNVDATVNANIMGVLSNNQLQKSALINTNAFLESETDLNSVTYSSTFLLSSSGDYAHNPISGLAGVLITIPTASNTFMQFAFGWNRGNYKRWKSVNGTWSEWIPLTEVLSTYGNDTGLPVSQNFITTQNSATAKSALAYTETIEGVVHLSLNNFKEPGYFVIGGTWVIDDGDVPAGTVVTAVHNEKYSSGYGGFLKQTIFDITSIDSNIPNPAYYRVSNVSGDYYSSWIPCGRRGFMHSESQKLSSCDLNDVRGDVIWLMTDSETYENAPFYDGLGRTVGTLIQSTLVSGWMMQIMIAFETGNAYRRFGQIDNWRSWAKMSGDTSQVTYNVTQNITQDTFDNTYNITANPTITTDNHNWLEAVDTETSDETGKTDMTAAIMAMLNSTGHCHLGEGIFYVSGNIDMPEGATLEGCGYKTVIRLLSSVSSGYTVRPHRLNTVKNIRFSGGYNAPADVTTVGANLGSRHGLYLVANADQSGSSVPATLNNNIESCWFENYNGSAFYTRNTGGGEKNSVIMNDCYIRACKVGINIDYYAEYAKYSNIIITDCNHACINNGGNNVFVGCTFHGVVGFLIDNSNNDKRNSAHGSVVGCTFNHMNNMNNPSELGMGDGIVVKGTSNGFLFNDCQIWYSAIKIENSKGIAISSCLIGGGSPVISVVGDYPAFISNCTFMATPSLTLNSATKMLNCYNATGAPIVNS